MEIKEIRQGDGTFQVIRLPEYPVTMEPGKPQLPVISEIIGIPDLSNVKVSIIESEEVTFSGYNIYPSQEPRLENESKPFVMDKHFYEQDIYYPSTDVQISQPHIWRDVRMVVLKVFPIKYNPFTKILKISRRIVVRLGYFGISDVNIFTTQRKPIKTEWNKLYQNTIINYGFLNFAKENKSLQKLTSESDYDYLIIVVDGHYDNIQQLAQWKTRKGLKTKVVKLVNDVGGGSSPDTTDIKDYIEDEYMDHNISFVLLVGDHDDLPLYHWTSGSFESGYGDYWYSDLSGDFPSAPEVAIGRISAASATEVDRMVNKILFYEQQPPITYINNNIWVKRSLLVADDDIYFWDEKNQEWILMEENYQECKETIESAHNNNLVFIEAYGGEGADNSDINNSINSGVGLVNYRGHGSFDSWWHWNEDVDYATNDASDLTNGDNTPVIFSIACYNAELQGSATTLAEAFIKNESGGAVAFLGATDETRTYANHYYDKKLYSALFKSPPLYKIGNVSNYAVTKMLTDNGEPGPNYQEEDAEWNAKRYLWLGDPTMEIWTDTPTEFTNVNITNNGSSITINTGISGCNIGACSEDNGSTFWEVAENMSSKTFTTSTRPLYITVTKHNYIPFTAITAGDLTVDQTWFGNIRVDGGVRIMSGATLTIQKGTTIKFNGYHSIVVRNGQISAVGTSSKPITFTSDTHTRQAWKNLYIYSSNNELKYCNFEYGNWAVNFYGYPSHASGNVVRNCTLSNNDQGLRIENSDTEVYDCLIEDNRHAFVIINTDVFMDGNTAQDNERDGVYCMNSTVDMFNNTLDNNGTGHVSTYHGIWAYSTSDIALGGRSWEDNYENTAGYNAVTNNHGAGVYVSSNSYVLIGDYHDITYQYMSTHNSLYGNGSYTGTYNAKQVYNLNSTFVKAKYNYWGGTPTSGMFYGNVSYLPYLSSNPLNREPIEPGPITSNNGILFKSNDGNISDVELKKQTIEDNKQFIADYPESPESVGALDETYHLIRGDYNNDLQERETTYDYLKSLYTDYPNLDVGKRALELMVNERMRARDMKNAIQHAEEGLKVLEGEANKSMMATLILFYIQEDRLLDAEKQFSEFASLYAKDENLMGLLSESFENAPQNVQKMSVNPRILNQSSDSKPVKYELYQNYPNPFNPATTINYELQDDSFVNISIYNIQGKLIMKLVDEKKSAGSHKVIWNADNLSSGVYIYKIEAGSFRAVRKLMLLK